MESSRFGDAAIRLGCHYAYCHQGDCEHIIVFTGVRKVAPQDLTNWFSYPLHTYQATVWHRQCSVCLVELAACVEASRGPARTCLLAH